MAANEDLDHSLKRREFDSELNNKAHEIESKVTISKNGRSSHWYWLKFIATFAVLIASIGHVVRLGYFGDDTCKLLMHKGRWVGDSWQPMGCMMHQYPPGEIRRCLVNSRVDFIGDSRIRQLFLHLQGLLSGKAVENKKIHHDLSYSEPGNISVNFLWESEVNKDMEKRVKLYLNDEKPLPLPQLLVLGSGTWTIKNKPIDHFIDYQDSLKKIKDHLLEIAKKPSKQPSPTPNLNDSIFPMVVWQLQDPVVERKLHEARKRITNEKIDLFNVEVLKSFKLTPISAFESGSLLAASRPDASEDGLHYTPEIISLELNVLLNAFCNHYLLPPDASCCMGAHHVTKLQYNTFAVFVTCLVLWLTMFICQFALSRKARDVEAAVDICTSESWLYSTQLYVVMTSLAKLSLILLYCFLSDRSLLFFKEGKHYSMTAFLIPCVGFVAIGILTKRDAIEPTIMNDEQVHEWRGWLVSFLLIYNYTGAEQALPAYILVKLVISAYLFIMGYEHFNYIWNSGDFGLYNVCKVVVRFNVLTVFLCLVLGRPYEFHYFILLGSFWYSIIYLFMALPQRVTASIASENHKMYGWIIAKFFLLFAVTYIIWGYQTIATWIFSKRGVRELFIDENGSIAEWVKKSSLDRYAVLCGMLVAFGVITARKFDVFCDERNRQHWLFKSKTLSIMANVIGSTCCVGYMIQAFTCHSRETCDATHSAAFIIPILGYFLLRNVSGYLRGKVSGFFVWMGEHYVEFFVAQYHMWLGSHQYGLLVLIPDQPVLNAMLTTFIFIIAVHELTAICNILSKSLVTEDVKVMLRRLCVGLVMLFIIWYHKTHDRKLK